MFGSGIRGTMAERFFSKSPGGSPSRQKPRQSRVAHCQCSSSPHPRRRKPLWHSLLFWQVTSQLRLIQRDCAGTKQEIRGMRNVLLCRILDTIYTILIQYWFNMIQSSHSAWLCMAIWWAAIKPRPRCAKGGDPCQHPLVRREVLMGPWYFWIWSQRNDSYGGLHSSFREAPGNHPNVAT